MVRLLFLLTTEQGPPKPLSPLPAIDGHSDAEVRILDGNGDVFPLDFFGPHRLVVVIGLTELLSLLV